MSPQMEVGASFARICIEMEVGADFSDVALFTYGDEGEFTYSQPVIYEWKPRQCPKCKVFGHEEGKCIPQKPAQSRQTYVPKGQMGGQRPSAVPTVHPGAVPTRQHREQGQAPSQTRVKGANAPKKPLQQHASQRSQPVSIPENRFSVLGEGPPDKGVSGQRSSAQNSEAPTQRPRGTRGRGIGASDKGKEIATEEASESESAGYDDESFLVDDFQVVGRRGRPPRGFGGTKLKGRNKVNTHIRFRLD